VSTCLSNTGTNTLVASFVAPAGVDAMTGLEAEIQVLGAAGAALPAWWNLQGGGCRATSTSVNFAPVGSAGCPDANDIPWTGGPVIEYPNLNGAPDRLFIRVIGAVAPPGVALTAGQEYRLFSLNINNSKTVGAGLCAGCGVPSCSIASSSISRRTRRRTVRAGAHRREPVGGGCGSATSAAA
jgi:hypothetical protein